MPNDELTYNGYTFPDETILKVKSSMRYDDADRTVSYQVYRIEATWLVAPYPQSDIAGPHNWHIHSRLSQPGKILRLRHDGFGPQLILNTSAGGLRDLAFGPKPRVLDWDPIGHTGAIEARWECEVHLKICKSGEMGRSQGIAALNYGVRHDIGRKGETVRVISGYLEIALTGNGERIPDTADRYRQFIIPGSPEHFHRETNWNTSPDKKRLDFTITDTEILTPNAWPAGVVNIESRTRVNANRRNQFGKVQVTLTATIELAANQPRERSWGIFRLMLLNRWGQFRNGRRAIFVELIDVDDNNFGYDTRFLCVYSLIQSLEETRDALATTLDNTGLWKQDNQFTWAHWKSSMRNVQSHGGLAQLQNLPSQDQLIDPCTTQFSPFARGTNRVPLPLHVFPEKMCNEKPYENQSWLRYQGVLEIVEDSTTVYQVTLGEDDLNRREFNPRNPGPANLETKSGTTIKRIVERGSAELTFRWRGYAERVGWEIQRPDKLRIDGVDLVPIGEGHFAQTNKGTLYCQPLYAAAWNLLFAAEARPDKASSLDVDIVGH